MPRVKKTNQTKKEDSILSLSKENPQKKKKTTKAPASDALLPDNAASNDTKVKKVEKKAAKAVSAASAKTMDELLSSLDYQIKGLKKREFVEGKITSITPKEILIDVGAKTEGILADKEKPLITDFLKSLKIGKFVKCLVLLTENEKGQPVLSLKKAGFAYKWDKINQRLDKKTIVTVKGREVNKGGLIVEFEGLRGFIPSSQLSFSHVAKPSQLINRDIEVKIIEVKPEQNRLIFSERQAIGDKHEAEKQEALSKINVGDVCQASITGIVNFGAFVNVNGVEGLVHISEISWEKVDNPSQYFRVGERIKVKIIGIDQKQGKLNLSLKQLTNDPWTDIDKKYQPGKKIKGKVSRMSAYGAFVSLEPGIEGLIHISKIPVEQEIKVDSQIECTIETIDHPRRRISLDIILTEKPVGYK